VRDDEVVIDLGREDGLEPGDRIDLSPRGQSTGWDRDDFSVIGLVDAVDEGRARVRIRWGESATVGSEVSTSDAARTGSLAAPSAPPRGLRLDAQLVLGTPVDDLGLQVMVHGSVELRLRRYFFARLRLRPAGVSVGKRREVGGGGAYVQLGFDQRYVGAALGVGVESVYIDATFGPMGVVEPARFAPWVTFPTSFRLGATDGLMAEVTTMLSVNDSSLAFVGVEGYLQVPLANGIWLGARGSGGPFMTFWHGEALVRLALRGNGQAGTTTLDVGVGAAGIRRVESVGRRTGPSIAVGLTHQL
jgi:hypothetical protein